MRRKPGRHACALRFSRVPRERLCFFRTHLKIVVTEDTRKVLRLELVCIESISGSQNAIARQIWSKLTLACEQAHLFGWGATTESWREEWGFAGSGLSLSPASDFDTLPKQVSLLPSFMGPPAKLAFRDVSCSLATRHHWCERKQTWPVIDQYQTYQQMVGKWPYITATM